MNNIMRKTQLNHACLVVASGLSRNQMTRPFAGSVSFESLRVVLRRAAVSETYDQSRPAL